MALWDLARALLRRWPIVLAAAVLTGASGFLVIKDRGVYFTRAEVAFLAPSSTRYPNSLQTRSEDLIITAGAVAKRVVGPREEPKYASNAATIVGATATREGYWIRLSDTGGQWATHFSDQFLLVDIVAPTPERVRELQQEAVTRIGDELRLFQDEQGVNEFSRITIREAPESTVLHRVAGNRARAAGVTALLGAAAAVVVVLGLDRRDRRRTIAGGRRGEEATRRASSSSW